MNRQHKSVAQVLPGPARNNFPSAQAEEVLVADVRARLTPADMVDRKFENLLRRHPRAAGDLRLDVPRDRGRTTAQ